MTRGKNRCGRFGRFQPCVLPSANIPAPNRLKNAWFDHQTIHYRIISILYSAIAPPSSQLCAWGVERPRWTRRSPLLCVAHTHCCNLVRMILHRDTTVRFTFRMCHGSVHCAQYMHWLDGWGWLGMDTLGMIICNTPGWYSRLYICVYWPITRPQSNWSCIRHARHFTCAARLIIYWHWYSGTGNTKLNIQRYVERSWI